ncbi:hypothetical protein D3C81_1576810 [compost metagenome]
MGQPAPYPEADEHDRQQAGGEQQQVLVGIDACDQEQRQAHHRTATDQRALGSAHLFLHLQPRAQVQGIKEAAAAEQGTEQPACRAHRHCPETRQTGRPHLHRQPVQGIGRDEQAHQQQQQV